VLIFTFYSDLEVILIYICSTLDTDSPGAVSKSSAIAALQASGEGSYDQVREVLKGVSVDASGKVELEDWVEVCVDCLS
jgi:plastin-1